MKRPTPVELEIRFEIDELFFSTTDLKGIIRGGNDVFIRASQYEKEVLINSPHNLIRHPDMPKCVFKLFWNTIQSQKPICAYVKNMSKNGGFYWVFASVVCIPGGYLSVRIKPTSKIFSLIPELYKELTIEEKENGVSYAEKLLEQKLIALGFSSYDDFMTKAIREELSSRKLLLSSLPVKKSNLIVDTTLKTMLDKARDIESYYDYSCSKLEIFANLPEVLKKKTDFIVKLSKDIGLSALNASLEAFRIGTSGEVLSVVAGEMAKSSNLAREVVTRLDNQAMKILSELKKSELDISLAKVQIEMVVFFIEQYIHGIQKKGASAEEKQEFSANCKMLLSQLKCSTDQVVETLNTLAYSVLNLRRDIQEFENIVLSVQVVQKTGAIESAKIGEEGKSFENMFKRMSDLIATAGREINGYSESVEMINIAIRDINEINQILYPALSQTDKCIEKINIVKVA